MKKQAGGTFLGVTIGLLVGLAAALLVAMYVTKTPIPLVDRGVQGKPEQDALEQERNKSWNPNAGWSSPTLPRALGGLDMLLVAASILPTCYGVVALYACLAARGRNVAQSGRAWKLANRGAGVVMPASSLSRVGVP